MSNVNAVEVLKKVGESLQNGAKVALVTVMYSSGSTPSTVGAMMVVTSFGESFGTIGGGAIEAAVIENARKAFESGNCFEFDYDLTKEGVLKMVCGGTVRGFVNILNPNKKLLIFGGGHIGQKIAKLAETLPFDVFVVDDRAEFAESFPCAKRYLTCSIEDALEIANVDLNTFVVIVTRGHSSDYQALTAVIKKTCAYIGLMGSRAKIVGIMEKLHNDGFSQEMIDIIHAPIGLQIANGTPEEIAFSILAEILGVKNKKL